MEGYLLPYGSLSAFLSPVDSRSIHKRQFQILTHCAPKPTSPPAQALPMLALDGGATLAPQGQNEGASAKMRSIWSADTRLVGVEAAGLWEPSRVHHSAAHMVMAELCPPQSRPNPTTSQRQTVTAAGDAALTGRGRLGEVLRALVDLTGVQEEGIRTQTPSEGRQGGQTGSRRSPQLKGRGLQGNQLCQQSNLRLPGSKIKTQ